MIAIKVMGFVNLTYICAKDVWEPSTLDCAFSHGICSSRVVRMLCFTAADEVPSDE
ncbi:MAG: hypothetical protein JST28_02715 [Acidobacteria bacterium]|nr:hypothetical protein [Acidobacteriota bacterium]